MLGRYLLTLLLTISLEGCITYLLGFRTRQSMLAVVLINVVTHVLLNYFLLVLTHLSVHITFASIAFLEILVIIAEWQMLVYVFHSSKGRSLGISTLANTASFFMGMLFFWV